MSFSTASVAKNCLEIFKSDLGLPLHQTENIHTATEGFIAYFDRLLEKNVIGEQELTRLIESLKAGQLTNPIDEAKAELKAELYEHFKGFEEYLEREDLNLERILKWVLNRLRERTRERENRLEVEKEMKLPRQEIEFAFLPAGNFLMGRKTSKTPVTLTHPFEAMTTPVTQWMWVEVMGENPSHFAEGESSIVLNVNGNPVSLQPDHPVESVTWWSKLVFANKLSEKHGFRPVYDLSGIQWKEGTRAENGTLDVESGEVKIHAPGGDYYEAEGYRLPTDAEQEYLMRAAGTADGDFHFGDDWAKLPDYAWFGENSSQRTHPVAELTPLIIKTSKGQSIFYDVLGNVWESAWNTGGTSGGVNPVRYDPEKNSRIARGGSHTNGAGFNTSDYHTNGGTNNRGDTSGLRLVRTLRDGE